MKFPDIQGAFSEVLIADALQCVPADGLTSGEAAMSEPLPVALHATRRLGSLLGKRVLVFGCGPIGILCILSARRAGAVGINALRPRGLIAQVGLGGNISLPMMALTSKELERRATFRFHEEFSTSVELMQKGLIDVKPLITQNIPISKALEAFELAGDRLQSIKTQISFG